MSTDLNPTFPLDLICPRCRTLRGNQLDVWRLRTTHTKLQCTNPGCTGEYPLAPYPIILRNLDVIAPFLAPLPNIEPPQPTPHSFFAHCPLSAHQMAALHKRSTYIWSHFFDRFEPPIVGHFTESPPFAKTAISLLDTVKIPRDAKALVVGCGPGREALELAPRLDTEIIAADIDPTLLSCLQTLLTTQQLPVFLRNSADAWRGPHTVTWTGRTGQIKPLCIDALDPPFLPETFDLIVALGLLDNVPDPVALLNQFNLLLRPGGHLLLATPFAWHPDVTPIDKRLMACAPDEHSEQVVLEQLLTGERALGYGPTMMFQACVITQIPWHLRIHARHFQTYITTVGLWHKPRL